MLRLTSTGGGLSVVVRCRRHASHDWMSFACWYSFSKSLPDAEITVEYVTDNARLPPFQWPNRCGVRVRHFSGERPAQMVIPPHVMAVRELSPEAASALQETCELREGVMCDAGEDRMVPFVSYEKRCGGFVTSDWINTTDCPFPWADRFMTNSATPNEVRVLRLWKQLNPLYITVRG